MSFLQYSMPLLSPSLLVSNRDFDDKESGRSSYPCLVGRSIEVPGAGLDGVNLCKLALAALEAWRLCCVGIAVRELPA